MDASDGTSQASPAFAGILALATQLRGADLGTVNPALAAIGPRGTAAGIIDVRAGYADSAYGVTGFSTAAGYDIASGRGTIYAPAFAPALVAQIHRQHGPGQPGEGQAQDELNRLQASISASASRVARGQAVTVTGKGFIPGRSPDGTTIDDGFGVYPAASRAVRGHERPPRRPGLHGAGTDLGRGNGYPHRTPAGLAATARRARSGRQRHRHGHHPHNRNGRRHVHADDHRPPADTDHFVPGQQSQPRLT